MSDIMPRLKSALEDRYAIEGEVGAGGMATVYLAEDLKHHRPVAIKVLRPELAAVIGPDRFLREIEISARLDHPHILPLFDSGEADGFLYYVMPYVEGESLRDKMAREKQLPVEEALQIAREVADALSYSHSRDIVHRDIKPENILLSEGHARVADFGIARAITAAGGDRLTQTGLAVGTPHYMSPEQAAGSGELDGRSDLYSLACVLFEMLGGQPPFTGPTVESVVHQHITVDPPSITGLRPAVPSTVAAALMRALAKTPADRFSPAAQFAEALRPVDVTAPTTAMASLPQPSNPLRETAVFALASIGVLAVVRLLVVLLGLPDWVFWGAVVLVVVGLPILVAANFAERRARDGTAMTGLLTRRNAIAGVVLAFSALAVVTAAYMAMRTMGIGPAGTLMATGAIAEREAIILADFENRTSDSAHGATVTELLRIGLSQSPVVSILDPSQVGRILTRMERDPAMGVPAAVALEAAQREGINAVITGEVTAVGSGFALAARLVTPTGDVLAAAQASATGPEEIVGAVDRLSGKLRERFGESLRSIRRSEPLDRVTTGSMRALRLYSQGMQAFIQGDESRAVQLLEEAVQVDTTFAMAYRKLGILLQNNLERRSRAVEVTTRAFELRDRLTERERYQVIGAYHLVTTGNRDQAISAYRTLLDAYPDDHTAVNNLGVLYGELRDVPRSIEYYRRAMELDPTIPLSFTNLAYAHARLFEFDSSTAVLDRLAERDPDNPVVTIYRVVVAAMKRDYDEAAEMGRVLMDEQRGRVAWEATALEWLASLDAMRGQVGSARRQWDQAFDVTAQRGLRGQYIQRAARRAVVEMFLEDDPERGLRIIEDALARFPLDSLAALDRPYGHLALAFAAANQTERARTLLDEYDATPQADHSFDAERWRHGAEGVLAFVEGRYDDALTELRRFDDGNECGSCAYPWLARTHEQAGQVDSAAALYERFVDTPSSAIWYDAGHLAHSYRRLGNILEDQGETARAIEYYTRFVELWERADPQLQPFVEDAKRRIAVLVGEPAGIN